MFEEFVFVPVLDSQDGTRFGLLAFSGAVADQADADAALQNIRDEGIADWNLDDVIVAMRTAGFDVFSIEEDEPIYL